MRRTKSARAKASASMDAIPMEILRRGNEMVVDDERNTRIMREPTLLIVIKAQCEQPVHRASRMDYVGIKLYTPDGRLEGELR